MRSFAADAQFAALLDQVDAGEEVVITCDGQPVARLVREPVPLRPSEPGSEQARTAAARLLELRAKMPHGLDWKALRDEGRR